MQQRSQRCSNGISDACDVLFGGITDLNGNSIPDECECIADIIANGTVNYSEPHHRDQQLGRTIPTAP